MSEFFTKKKKGVTKDGTRSGTLEKQTKVCKRWGVLNGEAVYDALL